jgi:hypothetical protein
MLQNEVFLEGDCVLPTISNKVGLQKDKEKRVYSKVVFVPFPCRISLFNDLEIFLCCL